MMANSRLEREKRSNGKTTTYEYAYRLVIKMYYSTVYIGSSFKREKNVDCIRLLDEC